MDELQLISRQEPGLVSIDNFAEMKEALSAVLARYENVVYSEESLAEAKADKKELTRLRKDIDDRRKEIKRAYLAPYNDFEAQVKELLAMIDAPLDQIKSFVDQMDERDKMAKWGEIAAYFLDKSAPLGSMARQVLDSPAFLDRKWLNKTTSPKTWKAAVDAKIAAAAWNLEQIRTTGGSHAGALTAKYLETLNADGLDAYREKLEAAERPVTPPPAGDGPVVSRTVKLTGTQAQLDEALALLTRAGIQWETVE